MYLPKLIGHRGAKNKAPENTFASIKEAARGGAEWVELDIQLTADNVPILLHDQTVNRTTNGCGKIASIPSNSLKLLDAGYWFDPKYSGETVPTLQETLDLCDKLKLGVNLEIKTYNDSAYNIVTQTLSVVNKFQQIFTDKLLFSSFDTNVLRILKQLAPGWPRGLLVDHFYEGLSVELSLYECFSLHPAISFLRSDKTVAQALGFDLPIIPYTVNDLNTAMRLAELDINTFITDEPRIFC